MYIYIFIIIIIIIIIKSLPIHTDLRSRLAVASDMDELFNIVAELKKRLIVSIKS